LEDRDEEVMISIDSQSVHPSPTTDYIALCQKFHKFVFPADYIEFLTRYNGGIPAGICVFDAETPQPNTCVLERFLPITEGYESSPDGMYDIIVVISELHSYLIKNPDSVNRIIYIPIALLFAGNYVCLDFSTTPPSICIWDHEKSDLFAPYTYPVAQNFSAFLSMLNIEGI